MTKRKQPDTLFCVYKGIEKVFEQRIPSSRINDQDAFLRALYAKFVISDHGEMVEMFVNKRAGTPFQHRHHKCHTSEDAERETMNRWCGDAYGLAVAITKVDKSFIDFEQKVRRENQGTHT